MAFSRARFWELLKAEPQPAPLLISQKVEAHDDYMIESLLLEMENGETIRGFVTRPSDTTHRHPALLYMHSHGGKYDIGADELLQGHDYIGPLGPVFARAGYVTLVIEMPLFGKRANFSESGLSMSMGCTHAFMLAALDDRIKAVAHLCCFADYEEMIYLGAHDGHGHYM